MQHRHAKSISLWLLIIMIVLFVILVMQLTSPPTPVERYTYANLLDDIAANNVIAVRITPDTDVSNVGIAEVTLSFGVRTVHIPNIDAFMQLLISARYYNPNLGIEINPPPRPG